MMIPLWLALASVLIGLVGVFYSPIVGCAFGPVLGAYGYVKLGFLLCFISVFGRIGLLLLRESV